MLNSEISQLNTKKSHRAKSQKYQQIVTEKSTQGGNSLAYHQAVAKASRLLAMPIAILSVWGETETIKAAIGLESLLATDREISIKTLGIQGCSQYLERSHQCLAIADVRECHQYFQQKAPIDSYLGIPLLTRAGDFLGTLAVMDTQVHSFTPRDREMLETIGSWLVCELEREILLKAQVARFFDLNGDHGDNDPAAAVPVEQSLEASAKFNLLTHLSQALRTPLTAIVGMTSVLQRELYGPLNDKQQSYANIIHHSGQQLVAMVNEINNLGDFEQLDSKPVIKAVDIEMLCQQSIRDLEPILSQRRQSIELLIDSEQRIWLVDREKVRQILYYVLLNSLQGVNSGHHVGMHISGADNQLIIDIEPTRAHNLRVLPGGNIPSIDITHTQLGLVLSHVLAESHNGSLEQIGNHGYRLTLPVLAQGSE
jgi:signal transduction histidine kinase